MTIEWTDDYTEDSLIEKPAIEVFEKLGWDHINAFKETDGDLGITERTSRYDVILTTRLNIALHRLNATIPEECKTEVFQQVINQMIEDRSIRTPERANQELYKLLKDGVRVAFKGKDQEDIVENVKLIDWDHPENNEFLLISQLWIKGFPYTKRPDLIGFVNGIPLLLVELKRPDVHVRDAFEKNIRDYKKTIPQLFWYNAFIILSNGSESLMGTITSPLEDFTEWKKVEGEDDESEVSLKTIIRGTCEPSRFLDIIENFTLFQEGKSGLSKIVARYHQYFGVTSAIDAVLDIKENKGKLGVFWHTQGSGKSFSIIFFCQKVLRKISGEYSFLIVTDREFLDDQIYKTFESTGALYEPDTLCRAYSKERLQELLQEDHRYMFTLIHKFGTVGGVKYPVVNPRSNFIVITDEAHRSQYDILAGNMREALPNAGFLGFTGTPLMQGEGLTRKEFGDYISIYNFSQSIEDGATVPLHYESRIPHLQLINEAFDDELTELLEEAELDADQEEKLQRTLWKKYHLITREDRLETIAEDIVEHFMDRGHQGKAMVISIDRITAGKMYLKVQKYWNEKINRLQGQIQSLRKEGNNPEELAKIEETKAKVAYMQETDMALIISDTQGEIEEFEKIGMDIRPHRARIKNDDLDEKFKDYEDLLRIVFVCAMWITGFDAKPCSTIYLDKPMRNHTLMQTIARANRVFRDKQNGLIVDYIGIFRNLEKALAIYGASSGSGVKAGEMPIKMKEALVEELERAVKETIEFCKDRDIDLIEIQQLDGLERVRHIRDAVDILLKSDDDKRLFLSLVSEITLLFRAIKPHEREEEFRPIRKLLTILARRIRALTDTADISEVMKDIDELLDQSVAAEPYIMPEDLVEHLLSDLSRIDFDALLREFKKGRKWTFIQRLRAILSHRIERLLFTNKSRKELAERYRQLIEDYNEGAVDVDQHFQALLEFSKLVTEEEQRHLREGMTEEELALFDILMKPSPKMTKKDRYLVKSVAKDLLRKLKDERLRIDWRKTQQTRALVQVEIREGLHKLPEVYSDDIILEKRELIYEHIYESYWGEGESVYSSN